MGSYALIEGPFCFVKLILENSFSMALVHALVSFFSWMFGLHWYGARGYVYAF